VTILAAADMETVTWVLGIVSSIIGASIVLLLGAVVKKFSELTTAVNNLTTSVEVIKVELKRVDEHDEAIGTMKPRLDQVYYWGKQKGMGASA